MPLTTLDASAALVLIDLQKGIVGIPAAHPGAEVVARAARLARAFRSRRLPVVLVRVTGMAPGRTETATRRPLPPDFAELVPELDQQPEDHVVTKERVGAFIGTSLDPYLRERGITQIFLAGIATGSGVEATGRSAYDAGYNVVFVVDAMTDRSAETHRHSVEMVFPRIGETVTTDELVERLNLSPGPPGIS